MILETLEQRVERGQIRSIYDQGSYGVVPPKAPDIAGIRVLPIRLPHHTIDRRHLLEMPTKCCQRRGAWL